jgi:hypothetical protein
MELLVQLMAETQWPWMMAGWWTLQVVQEQHLQLIGWLLH